MDFIFSFFSVISVVSVVLTALWFLVPKGGENHFKYAMGVFIISVVIATFNAADSDNKTEKPVINTEISIDKAQAISGETTKYILEQLLEKCNIKYKEVDIIMDNSESSDINITKARIEFINKEDFNLAAEIIKKQTGIILVR